MKNLLLSILFLLVTGIVYGQGNNGETFELKKVLNEVNMALEKAQTSLTEANLPNFKSVNINFETVVAKAKNGKFKILIFSFGKSVEREFTQSVNYEFIPRIDKEKAAEKKEIISLSDQLISSMITIGENVKNIRKENPLELNGVSLQLKFVVVKSGKPGIEFEIAPLTFGFDKDIKNKAIHTVTLNFDND